MPQELKSFLNLCRAKDKEQQLLEIMLLGRSVDPEHLLWAVRQANQCGTPTYQLVCYYLKITNEGETKHGITVEHTDLAEYDRLIGGETNDD